MPRKRQRGLDAYIGARLRLRRLMLGLSQEALGEKLALTFQQVQKYEKGANRISASRLYELSQVLDVPVQYFYDGLDEESASYQGLHEDETPIDMGGDKGKANKNKESAQKGWRKNSNEDVSPYLDFVSSSEGVQLNQAFLEIGDNALRRQVLGVMTELARIAASAKF